jgi:hypothetical protein
MIRRHPHLSLSLALFALAAASLLPASAAEVAVAKQRPLYVPGRVIVKYKLGAGFTEHLEALQMLAAKEEHALGTVSRLSLVQLPADTDVMAAIQQLEASGLVEYAEPDYYRYPTALGYSINTGATALANCRHTLSYPAAAVPTPTACVSPTDPDFQFQWYAENKGTVTKHSDIGLTAAWGLFCAPSAGACGNLQHDPATVTSSFKVAIIDDGFDVSNPDLEANLLNGVDCSGGTCTTPSSTAANATATDGSQDHGTFVASTIGAVGANGKAMAGVAWHVQIIPIKTDLSESAIVAGIGFAIAQHARIINESFGGPVPSQAEYDALADAENANILVVVAAGNSDSNNDRAGAAYPANYAQQTVIFPKTDAKGDILPGAITTRPGLPNVMAIAATDDTDTMTPWTQWGSLGVDLLAPGEDITALQRGGSGNIMNVAGTSFSSPITAGTAALVAQYLKDNASPASPNWHDLKMHLLNGAERNLDASDPAALDGRSATGRLNAYMAMQAVTHGVIVVRSVAVNDSTGGNNDGEIDPAETANIDVTVANTGPDDTNVQGTLSYVGSNSLASVSGPTTSGVAISQSGSGVNIVDGTTVMSFATTFSPTLHGNQSLLFKLHVTSANDAAGQDRYFYLESGTLTGGVTLSGSLTRNVYDDFQDFHVDVPAGAKNLVIYSTTKGGVDIDILAMKNRLPQYLETIGVDNPSSDPEFQQYIEPNAQISGRADGDESIAYDGLASPFDVAKRPDTTAGTYHVVVVNFTGHSNQAYTLTACYAAPGSDEVSFDGNYEYDDAAGNATLTLLRSGNSHAVSVKYASAAGGLDSSSRSATAGTNYSSVSGTVTWAAGDSSPKTISVPLKDTGIPTGSGQFLHFHVTLSSPTGGLGLGCIKSADVAIGNPATVIPSSTGGSTGGGGGGTPTPPPSGGKSGGGGVTGLFSLLGLGLALLRRRYIAK